MSARRTILLTLAAAMWTWVAGAMEDGERLQFADGLYARGLYALAVQEYTALLATNATHEAADQVYFRRGECHRHLGDRARADSDYRRVAAGFPQSEYRHRAAYRRAQLFLDGGQVEESIELFRAALDGKPPADVASACLYFLGEAQERKALSDEARGTWERMLAEYPDCEFAPYAQLKLGALYAGGLNAPDRALEFYSRAAAKPGTDRVAAEALFQMGELQFDQKAYEASSESYGRLIREHPGDARTAEAFLKAGWAAHYAGRYADALRYVTATNAAAGATNAAAVAGRLYLQANCERQLARSEAAIASYGRLIGAFPEWEHVSGARYELALVLYRSGRFEEAVAAALQVPETDPVSRDAYWVMAEAYAAMGRHDDAIQYYGLIVRKFPDGPLAADASYRLGHLLQAKGEFLEAARAFTKAATDAPNADVAPQALFASAFCFDKAGQREQAARDWGALVDRYPQHALAEEAQYQKGVIETRLERSADAAETFRKLAERYPQGRFAADAHYWRGMLLREAGRREDAAAELQLALKSSPRAELRREVEFGLALAMQDLGRSGEAADLLTPLVRTPVRSKFTPALSRWLAERQMERGQYTNAEETAELLIRQTGADAQLCAQAGWVVKGRAAMAMDRKDAAAEAFRKALALDVNSADAAEAALHLGDLALAGGNAAEAESCFGRAATMASTDRLLPVRAKAYAGLGRAASATNNAAGAARYFMSVAVLFDDDQLVPESLWLAAEAFRAAGQPEAAVKALSELRERYPDSPRAKALPASAGAATTTPP